VTRPVGINHVALEVGDVEEGLAFQGRFFEFTLRGRSRGENGLQQRPCIPAAQRLDAELREAGQSTAHVTRPEGERDPLGQQAASHERERSGRCAVEPLRVVDHAQESGCCSAASERRPRTASPTRNGLGACPALSPKATPSASR
jgi:hypothetical protein